MKQEITEKNIFDHLTTYPAGLTIIWKDDKGKQHRNEITMAFPDPIKPLYELDCNPHDNVIYHENIVRIIKNKKYYELRKYMFENRSRVFNHIKN